MSEAPADLETTPWKAAFTSALVRLQAPEYVEEGAQSFGRALDRLRAHPFIQSQVDEAARAGDEACQALLAARQVQLSKNHTVTLDAAWLLPEVQDRHQRWLIQQWRFVRDGIAQWRNKQDTGSLAALLLLLSSWYDVNARTEAPQHPESLSWHDHTTALRALNLLWLGCALRETELPEASYLPLLFNLMELHAAALVAKDFYNVGTNHGFDQAYSLYCLSAALPISETLRAAHPVAQQRLRFELAAAFNPEGVHVENSPTYHLTMTMRLLRGQKLLAAFESLPDSSIEPTVERALGFLTHALKPDGSVPLLGDSESTPIRLELESLSKFRAFAGLEYAYTKGKSGTEPGALEGIYPQAGYAFLRDRWPSPQDPSGVHVTLKCGFLSQFHRHDDDGTLLLFAFGEDWLVGSGIYKYHEQESRRRYLRSAGAHNILVVEQANVSRELDGLSSGIRTHTTSATSVSLQAETTMFQGFLYRRSLDFDRRDSSLALLDVMQPERDEPYDLSLRFHVSDDKVVTVLDDQRVRLTSPRSGRSLLIHVCEPTTRGVQVVAGRAEPPLGWTSPQVGALSRAQAVCFGFQAVGRVAVASRLSFAAAEAR